MAIITKSCGNFLDADGYFIDKKIIYFLGIPIYTYEFISANENIVVFVRKSSQKGDMLIAVANFENVPRKDYKIGVPAKGQYAEIFNSDAEKYDGFGFVNDKPVRSEKDECDGREDSIRIKVAPMAVSLFRYSEE